MTAERPTNLADVSRRRFLQGSAMAGFGAFLAACGGTGGLASATPSGGAASEAPAPSPTAKVISGPLKFANWPAYIDLVGSAGEAGEYAPGSSPTLEEFQETHSVEVDYQEKIGDNTEFVATIEPALVSGLATGWDLIVLTDFMAAKLVGNGWMEQIDPTSVPNAAANLRDSLRGVTFDPDNTYHYPWQSGMTGVGYNAAALAAENIAEPTKIADLWNIDPARVTFLSEARDTMPLTLLKLGIDPDPAALTNEDIDKAAADIQPLVDKGLRFTGNEYLENFANKNVWAAMVWSGDLASSGGEDDHFVFPEEGVMVWTDNMLIPKGAANKYTAELMIDFVYQPRIAAQIANYVYYVSPVEGASEEIIKLDPAAAENPLLFPPDDVVARSHNFQDLPTELEAYLNDQFAELSGV
jgi:spermidine/putrescine transport system substrate-binding protein